MKRIMIKILFLGILVFSGIIGVEAETTSCTYEFSYAHVASFNASIRDNYHFVIKISYSTDTDSLSTSVLEKGTMVGNIGFDISNSDLVSGNSKVTCPDVLYATSPGNIGDTRDFNLSFTKGSGGNAINGPMPVTKYESLGRTCVYGDDIKVKVHSAHKIEATYGGYNVIFDTEDQQKFVNGCPNKIYAVYYDHDNLGTTNDNDVKIQTTMPASGTDKKQYNLVDILDENNVSVKDQYSSVSCSSVLGNLTIPVNNVLSFVQYLGPLLAAVFATVEYIKAALSGDEKEMKKANSRLIKRIVAAIVIFLVPAITKMILTLAGITSATSCFK